MLQSDVFIFMQLMETCFDKLKNNYGPIPELILGKMAVAVSFLHFSIIYSCEKMKFCKIL